MQMHRLLYTSRGLRLGKNSDTIIRRSPPKLKKFSASHRRPNRFILKAYSDIAAASEMVDDVLRSLSNVSRIVANGSFQFARVTP